jgi:hypothetical protein
VTPRLQVGFAAQPLERLRTDLVIVGVAVDDRPLRGAAGRVDWRLCGQLSRLVASERFSGKWGEAALIGVAGGLRAPLVLALGLGFRIRLGALAWEALGEDSVKRALALGVGSVALGLPDPDGEPAENEAELDALLALLSGAARAAGASQASGDAGTTLGLTLISRRPDALEPLARAACDRGLLPAIAWASGSADLSPRGSAGSAKTTPSLAMPVKVPPRSPIL